MKKAAEEEPKKPRRRVKKVKGHGGHHGGAWKVAYADFVTAMMALFLVLWLVSQADTKLKQAIASYFRSPGVFDSMNGGILSSAKKVSTDPTSLTSKDEEMVLFSVSESLKKKFESKPEFSKLKDQVKIEVTEEGIKIELLDKADRVSFEVGSSELTPEAELILSEIAKAICDLPNPVIIGGHTDSRILQTTKGYSNWELSTDRANAARRFLQSECVAPEQIRRIIGFADSQPLLPNNPYAPANRRISITVARTLLPELQDGKAKQQPQPEENGQPPAKEEREAQAPKLEATPQKKESKIEEKKAAKEAEAIYRPQKIDDPNPEEPESGVVLKPRTKQPKAQAEEELPPIKKPE